MTAADDIEDLFNAGHPIEEIVARGPGQGWTDDDVNAVLVAKGWDLDRSGRLPRSKRTTVPRGLRGLTPAPAKPTTSTTSRHRTPTPIELNTDHAIGTARGVAVPDRLTGAALPVDPPTPAEALAEQSAFDVPVEPIELAREIRARDDEIAIEQTLRERAGLPSYFAELDDRLSGSPPLLVPAPVTEHPPDPDEPAAPPERPARPPCVVRDIMEPRAPIDPVQPRRRPRPQPPLSQRGRLPAGLDLDDWLDVAGRSPSRDVRNAADRACRLHELLHDALDELVRAEHNHARRTSE